MRISLNLILSELSKSYGDIKSFPGEYRKIGTLRIAENRDEITEKDILYLTDRKIWLQAPEGWKPSAPVIYGDPSKAPLSSWLNSIIGILDKYTRWERQLQEILNHGADLQSIADISFPVFGNAIYIVDSSFKVLALTDIPEMREMSAAWKFLAEHRYVHIGLVSGMNRHKELDELDRAVSPVFYNSHMFYNPFISSNIYVNHRFQGRLFIVGMLKSFRDEDLELAEYLTSVLSVAFERLPEFQIGSGRFYEHFLLDVLSGTLSDKRTILDQLPGLEWPPSDYYLVVYVPADTDDGVFIRSFTWEMERQLDSKSVLLDDGIGGIISVRSLKQRDEILKSLERFLKSVNKRAGVSNLYGDFSLTHQFYKQAKMLFAAGKSVLGNKRNLYAADELAVYSWGNLCTSSRERYLLCHPALKYLQNYDLEHETDYFRTLYVYLKNERHAKRTSEALFIHRNTLFKRLEKIQDLVSLNLDDFRIRMWLLLSFSYYEFMPGTQET